MSQKIIVNGKEYDGVAEMPADVRAAYEQMMKAFADENKNGVPDMLEGMLNLTADTNKDSTPGGATGTTPNVITTSSVTFVHDGKVYSRIEDLPPEARAQYDAAMKKFADANQNGVPDVLEGAVKNDAVGPPRPIVTVTTAQSQSASQPTSDNQQLLMGLAIIFLLAVIAALVVLLLIR